MECIDLYYMHRVDPKVPIEETVGAMKVTAASCPCMEDAATLHKQGALCNNPMHDVMAGS